MHWPRFWAPGPQAGGVAITGVHSQDLDLPPGLEVKQHRKGTRFLLDVGRAELPSPVGIPKRGR